MKVLGETDVILGVKIRKMENGFSLCQSHYIKKILEKFDCQDEIPARTPYDPSICLKKNKSDSVSQAELSRYTHNANNEHWNALHRLLRYLKGIMNLSWHFNKFSVVLEGFCAANWVTDNDEVLLVGQEAEWLKNLLGDVPLWGSTIPVSLHCDSQAAIEIAMNYAYNGKMRHIRIRHGAVKELLNNGIISLDYMKSERNFADSLTKRLTRRIIFES
ncbi:Copia protein [Sesamum angolense]|uniref:Copia protein n=1 Tax=Sesamum angolense TaxID=2727404 RepID=A0AAE1W7L3_9LAMI|nr:Copia protein [Sesamum angolense]